MKKTAEIIVEYLEYTSDALKYTPARGKDVGELLNKLNGRLFFTPSLGNVQIKAPTELLEILCEDKVLELFGELFDKWKPRVNETNLSHTKATFYKFFFEPIQENEAWQNFWEKQVQLIATRVKSENSEATEEEISKEIQKVHDQIASAIIYRIQQSWLNRQNQRITDDFARVFTESERAELLVRRNLLTAKVAVFATIINNSWNTLEHFLGSESNPEKGTIYFDFNDEMRTLERGLETRIAQILQMKKGSKKEEAISGLAADIHSARQGKGYRNLGEGVNEGKLQNALRVFVTKLMDDTSQKGKLVIESAAKGILEDIKNNLTQRIDDVNFPEYLITIHVLSTIENKDIKKTCKDLVLLCDTKKDTVTLYDKSEELTFSNNKGRERTETISEPSSYSPAQSPRLTPRHTLQHAPTKEKAPSLLERFFGKKGVDQNRPALKKNNSFIFPEEITDKETRKLKRATTSFFKVHDDRENQTPPKKSSLSTEFN
ncbi:hypothetical protein LEAN103870_12465 [Legionella anisa]|nr:hypothetical protein [Legionella anisa]KTC67068.1 hypothetical protein Lani_3413 [Legionella anisa]MBN5936021.1 hypothetical protein [Legionella anisa]MCW8424097.1 hypothetical protein [Legionella anisa]MCW8447620.1 hypothetical protein [Legionella anisa]UAK80868.1 hypothetical protein K8O89_07560 [Legionella anisa]